MQSIHNGSKFVEVTYLTEEEPSSMPEEGRKHDKEKPRWDLLPLATVARVVDVLTFGARKYEDENWKKVPNARKRYFAALMRHLYAHQQGERLDPETGLPHLSHAICCAIFIDWLESEEGKAYESERSKGSCADQG